jgi:hypothetical protein
MTHPGRTPAWCLVLVALMALGAALFLFPADSDAAFANYDGLWYGLNAERAGARCIVAHHILFHVAVIALVQPVEALGVPFAGGVACRIVAGAGAAIVLVLVASRARGRFLVGFGFAILLFSCRSFLVEAGVGENVLPACAAALAALVIASRPSPSPLAVGTAFAAALLFRQDNVLLLPAVVYATWTGLAPEGRGRRIVGALSAAGAAAAALSVAAWAIARSPGQSFAAWLFDLGRQDWTVPVAGPRVLAHADAFGIAAVGRHWEPQDHHLWIGAALLAAVALAAWCLRGDAAPSRFLRACALACAARVPFFIWFEAHNPEWHVLTWVLLAACGSAAAAGRPRASVFARAAGALLLIALPIVVIASHGPHTWRLRERNVMGAVRSLGNLDGTEIFAEGHHVATGFSVLGKRRTVLEGSRDQNVAFLFDRIARHPQPTVFVIDRMVLDGMPHALDHLSEYDSHLDTRGDTDELKLVRWQGRVFAFQYVPRATTRQAK